MLKERENLRKKSLKKKLPITYYNGNIGLYSIEIKEKLSTYFDINGKNN
jgi:hypothetical protein